jgi:fatty-acyl-CoA synthase
LTTCDGAPPTLANDALLWPTYANVGDLTTLETTPLDQRGLPSSTYDLLARAARLWPDRTAFSVLPDASHWTEPVRANYAALLARVHSTAQALHHLGVGRRDAVAIISPNCLELLFTLLACEAIGIAAPMNPNLSVEHMEQLVKASGARWIIAAGPQLDATVWNKARTLATSAKINTLLALQPTGEPELSAHQPSTSLPSPSPQGTDVASYFHTGGTTGSPKLAAHTHHNEVANAWMIAAREVLGDETVMFGALPLFHVNALLVTTLAPLFKAQEVVWAGPLGYRDPELFGVFWRLVEQYRITSMSGVPTIYAALSRVPIDADISSLQFAVVGAAPLSRSVRQAFQDHTGVRLCEGYGLTEATCASALNFPDYDRPDSVGQRLPYQHIKAVHYDPTTGTTIDLEPGERGVLLIKGPTIFPGYVTAGPLGPELERGERVVDGWLNTGDLGCIDLDGFVSLTGRAKDLIIRGGHNIDPATIEEALISHPFVEAVGAVGSPDPHAGEVPVAYAVLNKGSSVDPEELIEWTAARVPEPAAAPRSVVIVESLPVTDVGKPFKPELRRDATHRAVTRAVSSNSTEFTGTILTRLVDGNVVVQVTGNVDEEMRRILDSFPISWNSEDARS